MPSPTLKPEVLCWGRGDEISYLLRPVHEEPRSLTLIWGDSGIGKTTLLEEFHRTVGGGDYLAGFYQCQRDTAADPLLKCLQKLLDDRVYSIEEWPQVMIEGLRRVKERLRNPRQVGRLLAGAFGAVEKAPVAGKWAQVVSKGLGAAADLVGPGIGLPAEILRTDRRRRFAAMDRQDCRSLRKPKPDSLVYNYVATGLKRENRV